jgi:hypothetical protein
VCWCSETGKIFADREIFTNRRSKSTLLVSPWFRQSIKARSKSPRAASVVLFFSSPASFKPRLVRNADLSSPAAPSARLTLVLADAAAREGFVGVLFFESSARLLRDER